MLGRAVTFALLPLYTRVLAPDDFGALDLTLALSAFALVTVAVEVTQGLARTLPERADPADQAAETGTALTFGALAYGAFLVLGLIAAPWAGSALFARPDGATLISFGVAWVAFTGLLAIAQARLRFSLRPSAYAVSNGVLALGSAVASALLVLVLHFGAVGVLAGQVLGAVAALAISLRLAQPKPRFGIDRARLRAMLAFSLPLVPASVAVIGASYADRVTVGALLGLGDLGVYGVAVRIAALVGVLVIGFQNAIVPLIYANYRDPTTPSALARLARLYVGGSIVLVAGLALLGPEVVAIMATPAFGRAAVVLPLLASTVLLSSLANVAPGLAIERHTRPMAAIAIGCAVVTISLNLLLVPWFGITGAALASVAGAALTLFLTAALGQRRYRIPFDGPAILAGALVAGVVVAGTTVVAPAPGQDVPLRFGVMIIAVGLVIAIGLVRVSELVAAARGLGQLISRWGRGA